MRYGKIIHTALLYTVLWLIGPGAMAADRIPVFVSILPQKYFVEKIGGDAVTVSVMVKPGASPSTYEPRPRQMMVLSKARIYYAIGVPFETVWLNKFSAVNPDMKIIHTHKGILRVRMNAHADDGHHREILDPHIWTSPPLVKIQAKNILDALLDIDAAHKSGYTDRYNGFLQELNDIDNELRALFSKKTTRPPGFMVFHPAWGYFARTYGLRQIPIEMEGKSPKPSQIRQLIKNARRQGVRIIFVQPQFSAKNAEIIANAIGGKVLTADPLAPDWAANIRRQARIFEAALR
jgi:zinc transport system substrate-binding protein